VFEHALLRWTLRIAVVAAVGVITVLWRTRGRRRANRVELARIADVGDGARVRLVGRAIARDSDVLAPYSGRGCLAVYSATTLSNGLDRNDEHRKVAAFAVDDGSAIIDIDPEHAYVELPAAAVETAAPLAAVFGGAMLKRQLERSKVGKIVYLEGVLAAGDWVSVVGIVSRDAAGTPRLSGTRGQPVLITPADPVLPVASVA
jgi:hypothetical protein